MHKDLEYMHFTMRILVAVKWKYVVISKVWTEKLVVHTNVARQVCSKLCNILVAILLIEEITNTCNRRNNGGYETLLSRHTD